MPSGLPYLEVLEEEAQRQPVNTIESAPLDDEPFDPADLERNDTEPLIPHEEVARRLLS